MPDKYMVRFTQRVTPYNPGETAGFNADEAQALVLRGVAELVAYDEETGGFIPTAATLVVPSVTTAKQTAAGMFPPVQDASRAPASHIDDAIRPAGGSEGSRPDVATRAHQQMQEERGDQMPKEPFVIPAVQAPPAQDFAPSVDGPPPIEPGSPEEAERAVAAQQAAQQAGEEMQQESEPSEDEPKKRGRPRKE